MKNEYMKGSWNSFVDNYSLIRNILDMPYLLLHESLIHFENQEKNLGLFIFKKSIMLVEN